jgi:hypothetical protein
VGDKLMGTSTTQNKIDELKEKISNVSINSNIDLHQCINAEDNTLDLEKFLIRLKQ